MKILVTVTNYSKYCQAGKRILQDAGCEIIENTSGRPFTAEELEELVGDVSHGPLWLCQDHRPVRL